MGRLFEFDFPAGRSDKRQKDKNAVSGVLVQNEGKTKNGIQKLFGAGTTGTTKQVTGKAADSGYTQ